MKNQTGGYIRVLYPSGAFFKYVSREDAKRLIRERLAEGLGTKNNLRTVQLLEGPMQPVAGTKYSHNHETETNPSNVFELRQITHLERSLFYQVQIDCLA